MKILYVENIEWNIFVETCEENCISWIFNNPLVNCKRQNYCWSYASYSICIRLFINSLNVYKQTECVVATNNSLHSAHLSFNTVTRSDLSHCYCCCICFSFYLYWYWCICVYSECVWVTANTIRRLLVWVSAAALIWISINLI